MDYFEVFGLPRRLAVDTAALQRRFYDLARREHPDFHHAAPAPERARALQASALVNAAYRTLRDPIARADYLVRLEEGRRTREGGADRPPAPPALLAEMFEIQEALQEAMQEHEAGGLEPAARAALAAQRERLRERCRAEEVALRGPLAAAWDAALPADRPRALAALKAALAARAYLRTVIDDLGAALGEEQEADVAHRRD
jgi:molecular chaperone HscB